MFKKKIFPDNSQLLATTPSENMDIRIAELYKNRRYQC